MNTIKKLAALGAAGALVLALAGTASATVKWATPDDWYASTPGDGSNETAFWEDKFGLEEGDCTKLSAEAQDAVMNDDGSASLGVAYDFVVVKQANPNAKDVTYDNTIFEDVAADETVFADTNGDGVYDSKDSNGISHIIVCGPAETTTTTTTVATTTTTTVATTTTTTVATTTDTFSQSVSETTDATEPPTDTVAGNGGLSAAQSPWLLIAVLGALLASVLILTPSRGKTKR